MRISRFHIENYRGIRNASAEDLSRNPFVLLTGRNGTGKSLILEALAAAWAGEINLPDLVGPYANSLSIELAIQLSPEEYALLDGWLEETGQDVAEKKHEHVLTAIATSTQETGSYLNRDNVLEALQSRYFAHQYSFANIDLLSARRQPTLGVEVGVDLTLLDSEQNALQRREMMQEEIRWKNAQYMPDVGSYLTALDYREYVERRNGQEKPSEYERLQQAFLRATGKAVSRPDFDVNTGRPDIKITLPSKVAHGLSDLSNGEREMIGMFYYISQLASRGGVLLLDEPEKHLHPTLQAAVLEAIAAIAKQGQALIVTHSPTIVATVPQSQICTVRGAWEALENQLQWVSGPQGSVDVLSEIGISPRDMLQMEALLIVEGATDAKLLKMLFPEELSRVKVVEAGGQDQVVKASEVLAKTEIGIPHLCLVDRDYLTEAQVESLESRGLFVWRYRMLENVLLDSQLIACTLHKSLEEVEGDLRSCADRLAKDAKETFAEQRVLNLPLAHRHSKGKGLDDHIEYQIEVWRERQRRQADVTGSVYEEIDQKWDTSWAVYVDGKKLLGALHARWKVHSSKEVLAEFLIHAARSNEGVMPSELLRFRDELSGILARPEVDEKDSFNGESSLDSRVRQKMAVARQSPQLNLAEDGLIRGCIH